MPGTWIKFYYLTSSTTKIQTLRTYECQAGLLEATTMVAMSLRPELYLFLCETLWVSRLRMRFETILFRLCNRVSVLGTVHYGCYQIRWSGFSRRSWSAEGSTTMHYAFWLSRTWECMCDAYPKPAILRYVMVWVVGRSGWSSSSSACGSFSSWSYSVRASMWRQSRSQELLALDIGIPIGLIPSGLKIENKKAKVSLPSE